jgi:hypothetical protein
MHLVFCLVSINVISCSVYLVTWLIGLNFSRCLFQEQFFIMKPGEATTRLFDLHTSTDQAVKYQCTGGLETVQELKISCPVNLPVLGLNHHIPLCPIQLFWRRQTSVKWTEQNVISPLHLWFLIMEHRFWEKLVDNPAWCCRVQNILYLLEFTCWFKFKQKIVKL